MLCTGACTINARGAVCDFHEFGKAETGSIKDLILDRAHRDAGHVECARKRDTDKKQHRNDFANRTLAPEPCEKQCDEWRRREPPVVKHFDVVPDPRRHLQDVRHNEAESERQVEKQQPFRDQITFSAVKNRRKNKRNEECQCS